MGTRELLLAVGLALSTAGCGHPCEPVPGGPPCDTTTGGAGQTICVCPTTDEGAPCTDAGDCQGVCLGDRTSICEEHTSGRCSSTRTVFGCACHVEGGEGQLLCVD